MHSQWSVQRDNTLHSYGRLHYLLTSSLICTSEPSPMLAHMETMKYGATCTATVELLAASPTIPFREHVQLRSNNTQQLPAFTFEPQTQARSDSNNTSSIDTSNVCFCGLETSTVIRMHPTDAACDGQVNHPHTEVPLKPPKKSTSLTPPGVIRMHPTDAACGGQVNHPHTEVPLKPPKKSTSLTPPGAFKGFSPTTLTYPHCICVKQHAYAQI